MGGIGWVQLLIIAVIVILLFGTNKLRGMGGDLGSAIKGFKKALHEEDIEDNQKPATKEKQTADPALKKDPTRTQKTQHKDKN